MTIIPPRNDQLLVYELFLSRHRHASGHRIPRHRLDDILRTCLVHNNAKQAVLAASRWVACRTAQQTHAKTALPSRVQQAERTTRPGSGVYVAYYSDQPSPSLESTLEVTPADSLTSYCTSPIGQEMGTGNAGPADPA